MEVDIAGVLAQFAMALVVYALLNKQLDYLTKRVAKLEEELEKTDTAHKDDLRKWAGINQGAVGVEEDTRRIRLAADKQRQIREAWERRQQLEDEVERGDVGGAG